MTHHLGYEKNQSRPGANSRNGYSTKTVITGDGPLELRTPRDRNGTFEPQLVKKNRTRITGIDNQILSLYAKGMTTREIAAAFKELYDADVSPALISKVTDAVMEQVVEWQNRPLDAVYPIVYLDCIVLKVRQDSRYPQISRSWQANWPNLATFFAYPTDIRKVIYTTNAIESLNSVIRHAIKKRKVFPTDDSVKKVVWLAIQSASQKWTMPLKDWQMAMSRFIIEFGERLDSHF
ncbi:hypothetical protein A1S5_00027 [Escherichia coli KTE48]|nr:hypothetical protein A1S5_00027 [Escherichia coli KTE48]